ncbi:MAG: winged helix-turn-helix transcriptional regulator [Gemmatimonadetes bacterium]|nr:winged helix-turn-helix transcriptional regulator [Gemmatimonadota bacterium]
MTEATPAGEVARFFQALADETRLALVDLLRERERTVGELVEEVGCPQPKVSRHLKVLKEAGLVRDRRDGRNVSYALVTRPHWPAEVRRWIDGLEAGLPAAEFLGEAGRTSTADVVSSGAKDRRRTAVRPHDLDSYLL